jgi:hypothetical protein
MRGTQGGEKWLRNHIVSGPPHCGCAGAVRPGLACPRRRPHGRAPMRAYGRFPAAVFVKGTSPARRPASP